jgi:outer membrane autotransporter protein
MTKSARSALRLGLFGLALLAPFPAHAECGGSQQCIAVSIDPAVTPEHGTPLVSDPISFGNQPVGTESAARTIFVRAVTGPAGTLATLDAIALGGANAGDFRIAGGTCTTGIASLPQDGASCTVTVTFNPATAGAKSATVAVQTTAITRTVPLAGTGTTTLATATPATLTVQADTPTTLDLAAFIGGTGALTVGITTAPANGVVTVSGTRVTYTPAPGFLGGDAFAYAVTDDSGTSAPAAVTLNVVARADPTADPAVMGLLRAQAQTARRFANAQIANIHARLESLHARPGPALAARPAGRFAQPGGPGLRAPVLAATPAALDPAAARASDAPLLPAVLASALAGATQTGSLNLSARGGTAERGAGATGMWIGGSAQFGGRDQTSDANALRFSTDGLSAGIDRRLSERLALGLSVGYARDRTDIGSDGSHTRARGSSIAFYGSYQPGANTFVDALLGYGALEFDTERFVAAANDFARAARNGGQWFGSLAAGYEFREESLLVSPYGRLDFARARLKSYSESGAGLNALTYFEQTVPTLQFALGLRMESAHEASFGWVLPRLRVELRHDAKGEGEARLAYADLPGGPVFSVTPSRDRRNSLLLGIGSDFVLRNGLRLGLDYQIQRLSGIARHQALRVWLAKDLDGKGLTPGLALAQPLGNAVHVEASHTWDSNINRARDSGDKLADRIYGINAGTGRTIALGMNTRLVAAGFLSGDKFVRYPGLDRFSVGAQGELQYRASGDFGVPIFGLLARVSFDEHAGQLRSGHRQSLGLTYRQSLTDRVELFAALTGSARRAEHDVFDARDWAARLNFDYALGRMGALYLGGEYRRGDTVSALPSSPAYASFAKASVQDDAYGAEPRMAYRYDAKTVLWTFGWNLPLGPMDALDISLRRAESKPTAALDPIYGASSRYTASQLSLAYLMRF